MAFKVYDVTNIVKIGIKSKDAFIRLLLAYKSNATFLGDVKRNKACAIELPLSQSL